jgi:hypothetical protein
MVTTKKFEGQIDETLKFNSFEVTLSGKISISRIYEMNGTVPLR